MLDPVAVAGTAFLDVIGLGSTPFAEELDAYNMHPRGIAEATLRYFVPLFHTVEDKRWLRWNGQYYEDYTIPMHSELIWSVTSFALAKCQALLSEAKEEDGKSTERRRLSELKGRLTATSFKNQVEELMRDRSGVSASEFDADSSILACESGILDREAAKRGEVRWLPHDPARKTTRCIPLAYDPTSKCPEWEAFLASSTKHSDRLQVMLGFALAGDNTHKKRIVNLVGPTDTGKSTVLDILDSIIGCYLGTMRTDEITVSRHNAKFDFHGLRGSRAVFCSEPEPRAKFRIADLKRITGGELIVTEGKGKDPISWRASVMPFIGTNVHIYFDVTDEAFEQRLEYIEFERTREIDRQLKKRLLAERAGIFNWILAGVIAYFAGEVEDTPESLAARYRAESTVSPPLQFVAEAIEAGKLEEHTDLPASKYISVGELFPRYQFWCSEENIKAYGRREFSRVIQKRYPKCDKASGGGKQRFVGLALKGA